MSPQNKRYFFHFLESDKNAPVVSSSDGPATDTENASRNAQNQESAINTRKSQFLNSRIIWRDLSNTQASLSKNLADQIVSSADSKLEDTLKSTLISEYKNTVNAKIGERLENKLRSAIDTDSLYEKSYNSMNFTQFFSDCTHDPKICSQGGPSSFRSVLARETMMGGMMRSFGMLLKERLLVSLLLHLPI